MSTKRERKSRSIIPKISEVALHALSDGLYPLPHGSEKELAEWNFFTSEERKRELWHQCKIMVLDEWIRQHPGTRPSLWWLYDAPEKVRRRLGGIGDPAHEHLALVPRFECGIPTAFLDPWLCDYFNGQAKDIHGDIVSGYNNGDFKERPIDPKRPPVFESQPTYLKRHGLLTASEKRLKRKNFEPEIVLPEEEEAA